MKNAKDFINAIENCLKCELCKNERLLDCNIIIDDEAVSNVFSKLNDEMYCWHLLEGGVMVDEILFNGKQFIMNEFLKYFSLHLSATCENCNSEISYPTYVSYDEKFNSDLSKRYQFKTDENYYKLYIYTDQIEVEIYGIFPAYQSHILPVFNIDFSDLNKLASKINNLIILK